MIRVLQMLGTLDRGGQETFVMNVYRNIDREKVQFDFVVSDNGSEKYDYEDEIYNLGGRIFKVTLKSKKILKSFCQTIKVVKDGDYKIVHKHSNISLMYIDLIAAKLGGAKILIAHSHSSTLSSPFKKIIHKIFIPLLDLVSTNKFACSKEAGIWLFGKQNFTVIKNGIDINKFSYNEKVRNDIRKKMKIEGKFVIGHVGRFEYVKNHGFLIDIFNEIKKNYPDAVLILAGDGPLREKTEQKIKELDLYNNVILLGVRNDIFSLLQAFDVFILPSYYEGLPITLIEAQSSGLPCIISDTISSEIRITGLTVSMSLNDSSVHWAEKVLEYGINNDRVNTADQIKAAGYDIQSTADLLTKFYIKQYRSAEK